MATFAIIGAAGEIAQPGQTVVDRRQHAALPHGQMRLGAKDMAHDEILVLGQSLVDDGDGIAAIAVDGAQRRLIGFQRFGAGLRNRNAANVMHGISPQCIRCDNASLPLIVREAIGGGQRRPGDCYLAETQNPGAGQ